MGRWEIFQSQAIKPFMAPAIRHGLVLISSCLYKSPDFNFPDIQLVLVLRSQQFCPTRSTSAQRKALSMILGEFMKLHALESHITFLALWMKFNRNKRTKAIEDLAILVFKYRPWVNFTSIVVTGPQ